MHKGLGDKFYRKKGVVESVKDNFTAIVQMLDSRDKLRIDQSHLETVIPAIGEQTWYLRHISLDFIAFTFFSHHHEQVSLCLLLPVSIKAAKRCLKDWMSTDIAFPS